jgi:hypothetical protein
MTFLPIVDRELRVASRLTATYRNRALTAAVVALVAMAMLLFGAFVPFPSRVGRSMFATLSFLIAIFAALKDCGKPPIASAKKNAKAPSACSFSRI